ncbi:unnamed protein product [Macrosiphum euphorbiae]|uniref:Uncharacterized protein n=1 Tax=Macrosiphum euphorbiae TaxID=13131 RepID=A0AAV0XCR8_9HEMI|nr:unnamed protein product [Macrosiphum euphorbiae]
MGNYQDSNVRQEYNLNAMKLHERYKNAKIKCIFDAQSGKLIKMDQRKLDSILTDPDFYYHGTSECAAFSIVCDELRPPKEDGHRRHNLGNGLFVSDNINHSFGYGSCVFICYVRFKNTLEINFETDLDKMFSMIDTVFDKYETVKFICRYGRHYMPNKNSDGEDIRVHHTSFIDMFTPNFTEYRIKTVSSIVPKYLFKFDNVVGIRDENQIIDAVENESFIYQTFCIYDNSEYMKYYDGLEDEQKKFQELNLAIKSNSYFFVPLFFCEALDFLRSSYHTDVYTLQENFISKKVNDYTDTQSLLNYFKMGLMFHSAMSNLKNKYLAACHLKVDGTNEEITPARINRLLL